MEKEPKINPFSGNVFKKDLTPEKIAQRELEKQATIDSSMDSLTEAEKATILEGLKEGGEK
jgi:hypothetical protein